MCLDRPPSAPNHRDGIGWIHTRGWIDRNEVNTGELLRQLRRQRARRAGECEPPPRPDDAKQCHDGGGITRWQLVRARSPTETRDAITPCGVPATRGAAEMTRDDTPALHPLGQQDQKSFGVILRTAQVIGEFDMHGD